MTLEPSLDGMSKLLAAVPQEAREAMVRMYRQALESELVLLAQALEQAESKAAASVAHKMAGLAGMMQDQSLSQAARKVEAELREGSHERALQQWLALRLRTALTLEFLRQAYPGRA